jgi:L-lactate dehydrogenase complex protein LldF
VARLFHEKLGTDADLPPQALTMIAREQLRKRYRTAEIGITGGNFLLADVGAVCVTENEGNARLSTTFPKTQISIVGIEKIIPSINDLPLFWPLLATYGTGQKITVYNTIFGGPKQRNEDDGPEEMYVILLDNGRTNIYQQPEVRESLYCIRCGSCLNACPVYKNIGGHTYGTTYSGPIGAVISPHLSGLDEYKHLSYASSLCGNCTEVCPLKINLHEMLLENRHLAATQGLNGWSEGTSWKVWRRGMLSRTLMNAAGSGIKNMLLNKVFGNTWFQRRGGTAFASKSFNQMWKERNK